MAPRVAKRYAKALFLAAEKLGQLDAVSADLARIADTIAADSDLRTSMVSPLVGRDDKHRQVDRVFPSSTPLTRKLLQLLIEKRRENALEGVRAEFERLHEEKQGVVRMRIMSAQPLTSDLRQKLIARMESLTGKKVLATDEIDSDLIGGVSVQIADGLLDGTVRGELRRLRERFIRELARQG